MNDDLNELLDLLAPLMDPDDCSPFYSAWEMSHNVNGEQLHEKIKTVYDRLRPT